VRGLTTVLLVGGLGVEDRLSSFCEISVVFHVISCCGFEPKSTDENQDIESTETKITYTLLQSS
jgi:hypothetical protein